MKNILFIQGGGDGGYDFDKKLVNSLQASLGSNFTVHYPRLRTDESLPDLGWLQQIGKEFFGINGEIVLVGHSLGASMLLKFISENEIKNKISGIFLISTPYWSGAEDWIQGLKLKVDFADKLSKDVPVFLYHCRDDKEVPFEHLLLYEQKLSHATIRKKENGGHQLNNDLTIIAQDIKSLSNQNF